MKLSLSENMRQNVYAGKREELILQGEREGIVVPREIERHQWRLREDRWRQRA